MDLLAIIGLFLLSYYLVYLILPLIVDCDLLLAFTEKFGKPVCKYIHFYKKLFLIFFFDKKQKCGSLNETHLEMIYNWQQNNIDCRNPSAIRLKSYVVQNVLE